MVVAKTDEAYEGLVAAMGVREVSRTYLALVGGDVRPPRGPHRGADGPFGPGEHPGGGGVRGPGSRDRVHGARAIRLLDPDRGPPRDAIEMVEPLPSDLAAVLQTLEADR
jgi:hypothetical protein